MYNNNPIDFVRFVTPFVRDTYEMRGSRRNSIGDELIWWHPKMRDFLYMDEMSKRDLSQFIGMNIIVNEALAKGYVQLSPIEDPPYPFFALDILDRSNYYELRKQVIPSSTFNKEILHETYF